MRSLSSGYRRAVGVAATVMTLLILGATPALADPGRSQAPWFLTWISLTDTRGISVWKYEMSIDRGGMTSPGKFFWSVLVDISWQIYRAVCVIALWFLDWVLSFTWVPVIATPLLAVGDAMQSTVSGLGLVPVLLTFTALVAVLWMARGRWATGIWELAMALVIAALASGVFAQPVAMIAGTDGLLVKTNQAGQELAAELATGEAAGKTSEELRAEQTGLLVDTFIRQPTQMINFGQVLDGTECEAAYNEVVADGPYGNDADIRDRVKDCNDDLYEYANDPTAAMAAGSIMFSPAAFVVLGMAVVLAGAVVAAGCWAMFQSVKAIIALITGLLPGGGRGSLLLTITETLVSLLIILFTSVFLAVFLLVIQAIFASADGEIAKTFFIVDILILVGIIVYWRARKRIKGMSERLATWMAQRPGASATSLPQRSPGLSMAPVNSALNAASSLGHLRAARRARPAADAGSTPGFVDGRRQTMIFINNGGRRPPGPTPHYDAEPVPGRGPGGGTGGRPMLSGSSTPPGLPPGPSASAGPGSPDQPPPPRSRLQRVAKATGTLARAGTNIALGAATGGTSTAVAGAAGATKAAKAAKTIRTARRAGVAARMASGSSAPSGPMRRRSQAAPVPGRSRQQGDDQAGSPRGAVVQGQVVSSKLSGASVSTPRRGPDSSPAAAKGTTPPPHRTQDSSAPAGKAAPGSSRAQNRRKTGKPAGPVVSARQERRQRGRTQPPQSATPQGARTKRTATNGQAPAAPKPSKSAGAAPRDRRTGQQSAPSAPPAPAQKERLGLPRKEVRSSQAVPPDGAARLQQRLSARTNGRRSEPSQTRKR